MVKNEVIKVKANEYKDEIVKFMETDRVFDNELLNKLDADLVILVDYSEGDLTQLYKCKEYPKIIKTQDNLSIIGYFIINDNIFSKIDDDYSKLELYKYYMVHRNYS